MIRRAWMAVAIVGITAGCGGSTAPSSPASPPGTPGIAFLSGNAASDTALAVLANAVVVEVRTSTGAIPAPGTVVHFDAVRGPLESDYEVFVSSSPNISSFSESANGMTDGVGQAAVYVRLGVAAGTARMVVSVPTLSFVDTAQFSTTPGVPTHLIVTPPDSTLLVGSVETLTGSLTDQHGNLVSTATTWTANNTSAEVTSDGTATGQTVGRDTLTATGAGLTAQAYVSVVPVGRLVGVRGGSPNLVLVDMDGSNLRTIAQVQDAGIGIRARWLPDGGSLVYTAVPGMHPMLMRADTAGNAEPFFAAAIPHVSDQADPVPTADGQWLYFSAHDSTCTIEAYCLYRAHIDGSVPELIGDSTMANKSLRPSPSPDGSMVAFMKSNGNNVASTIAVEDVGTGTLTATTLAGVEPAWSPDGSTIAYISRANGVITLVAPDGSGARSLTPLDRLYQEGNPVSWSADGKYLLARAGAGTYDIIDTQTGAYVPLPFTSTYVSLTLR